MAKGGEIWHFRLNVQSSNVSDVFKGMKVRLGVVHQLSAATGTNVLFKFKNRIEAPDDSFFPLRKDVIVSF